jgi:hypothetical protein
MGGGGYYYGGPTKKQIVDAVFERLKAHPNFEYPKRPEGRTTEEVVAFTVEAVARLLSPPKIEGEDDSFACTDLAETVRTRLGPEILMLLEGAEAPRPLAVPRAVTGLARFLEWLADGGIVLSYWNPDRGELMPILYASGDLEANYRLRMPVVDGTKVKRAT